MTRNHLLSTVYVEEYLGGARRRRIQRGAACTHDVSGVDAEAAEKCFVAVGAAPLVSEAERLVDVLKLRPHATVHGPVAPIRRSGVKNRVHEWEQLLMERVRKHLWITHNQEVR